VDGKRVSWRDGHAVLKSLAEIILNDGRGTLMMDANPVYELRAHNFEFADHTSN
jgi:hypothetical protein